MDKRDSEEDINSATCTSVEGEEEEEEEGEGVKRGGGRGGAGWAGGVERVNAKRKHHNTIKYANKNKKDDIAINVNNNCVHSKKTREEEEVVVGVKEVMNIKKS